MPYDVKEKYWTVYAGGLNLTAFLSIMYLKVLGESNQLKGTVYC